MLYSVIVSAQAEPDWTPGSGRVEPFPRRRGMTAICAKALLRPCSECPETKRARHLKRRSEFSLKPGDQRLQERAQRFLLGLAQRQQKPLLIRDMAADRLVDQAFSRLGQYDQLAAPVPGSGRRTTSPARSSLSSRSVMPPDEIIVAS